MVNYVNMIQVIKHASIQIFLVMVVM